VLGPFLFSGGFSTCLILVFVACSAFSCCSDSVAVFGFFSAFRGLVACSRSSASAFSLCLCVHTWYFFCLLAAFGGAEAFLEDCATSAR
jgi:hypothetical protein